LFREFSTKPCPRDRPVTLHGYGGDTERFGGFLRGKTAEEAKFDDTRLTGIELTQPRQREVNRNYVVIPFREKQGRLIEINFFDRSGALGGTFGPRVIDQNASHCRRRNRKEVRAVAPTPAILDEAQIGFVN